MHFKYSNGSNPFFHFMQFSKINGQNNRFAPLPLGLAPPGNPRSATEVSKNPTILRKN